MDIEVKNISTPEDQDLNKDKFEFEKYKFRVELYKWLIASVGLVLITTVINYGFKDRASGLQEIQQYDKYVTELIVLNQDIGQKRMLAQFFAHVTPSEKLKKGWQSYYNVIDEEYQKQIAPVIKSDSIAKQTYYKLYGKDTLTKEEAIQKEKLKAQIELNKTILNPKIKLPATNDFQSASKWEQKGFESLINHNVEAAISSFQASEESYNQFHQVYEIANFLRNNKDKLKEENSPYWEEALQKIAKNYSWKMPIDFKEKLLDNKN